MASRYNRREFLKSGAALTGAAAASMLLPSFAIGQSAKIKAGLMLPWTGTFSPMGVAIENGFRLALAQRGGKFGGREIEIVRVDDESDPAKAMENTNKLVQREKVDVLVGTVHSGVVMGMVKVARETGILHIIPNAGLAAATGPLCAPNIFRTSFTNWQIIYPLGNVLMERGLKTAVFATWKYAAGEESLGGFRDGYVKAGGKILKEMFLSFPEMEFQPLITEITSIKPDAVACFFSGGAAIKLIKEYAMAGLKTKIPLCGPGTVTDSSLDEIGDAAEGMLTTLHYGDGLDTKRNNEFRAAYGKAFKMRPDVFAVQGYDTGLLLAAGLDAVKGEVANRQGMIKAIETTKIDSPRGIWTMSKAHNPIQDIYLRKVIGKENKVIGVASKALADPATGCKMI